MMLLTLELNERVTKGAKMVMELNRLMEVKTPENLAKAKIIGDKLNKVKLMELEMYIHRAATINADRMGV